jgi:hypothetical protein
LLQRRKSERGAVTVLVAGGDYGSGSGDVGERSGEVLDTAVWAK